MPNLYEGERDELCKNGREGRHLIPAKKILEGPRTASSARINNLHSGLFSSPMSVIASQISAFEFYRTLTMKASMALHYLNHRGP
jgi:hypothetical protein